MLPRGDIGFTPHSCGNLMKIGDTIKTPVVPQKYTSFPNVITRLDRVIQKQPAIYFVGWVLNPPYGGGLKSWGYLFFRGFLNLEQA